MESEQIAVRLPRALLAEVDDVVARGRARSRAGAVRAGLEILIRIERERQIAEEYARAYGTHPQEPWVGDVGLVLGARYLMDEPRP